MKFIFVYHHNVKIVKYLRHVFFILDLSLVLTFDFAVAKLYYVIEPNYSFIPFFLPYPQVQNRDVSLLLHTVSFSLIRSTKCGSTRLQDFTFRTSSLNESLLWLQQCPLPKNDIKWAIACLLLHHNLFNKRQLSWFFSIFFYLLIITTDPNFFT